MKYHLHIVDSGGAPSVATSSASTNLAAAAPLLFAHFALRCGHLYDVLELSASTASDTARPPLVVDELDSEIDANDDEVDEQDTQLTVLRAVAAVLQMPQVTPDGPAQLPAALQQAVEESFLPGADWSLVRPYPFFAQPFTKAEQQLARCGSSAPSAAAPYYSFIAAADLAAYEYVVQYYQRLRLQAHGAVEERAPRRPVAVLHVMNTNVERSSQALQRVLEAVLEIQLAKVADQTSAEAAALAVANEDAMDDDMNDDISVNDDEWLERIESAVSLSNQVLGIDVLLTIV